ncbi:MAG: PAS domain-containing protein [Myxococcales bacterium]|nr:PAS domain-containing protein [Myxococcales bacterium]
MRTALQLADVLEAMPTALMVMDERGFIRFINERAAAILRRPAADLLGRSSVDLWGELPCDLFEPERPEGDERNECELQLPDGSLVLLGYSVSYTRGDDGLELAVVVFQDISQLVVLRDERDRLMRLAAIGEALPSLLHELKNPLAAVTTAAEVLVEEVSDQHIAEQLHAIVSEVRRMKLGFEGIGAVGRRLRADRFAAVDYAAREATRVLEARAQGAGVHLRSFIEDMPLLKVDPAMVRAIVFNLVTNAIVACERDDTVAVHVRFLHGPRACEIMVVDNGSGMTPSVAARATELFFTTKPSGSGIGLALCRRAVEEAGGTLTLKSVPGSGTSVCIRVPADQPPRKRITNPNQRITTCHASKS